MAQPPTPRRPPSALHASTHQPSSVLRLRTPFAAAFMPLVPLASSGGRGVLSQTSHALHEVAGHRRVVVLDEDDVPRTAPSWRELDDALDQPPCRRRRAGAPCRR
jgi:hypothetical protein